MFLPFLIFSKRASRLMFFLMKISSDSRMWTGWNSHWCSLFKRYDRPTTWLTRYACLFSQDYAKKSSNVIRQTSTDTMTHEPKTFEMIHRAVARRIMENLPLKSRFTCPHSRMPVLGNFSQGRIFHRISLLHSDMQYLMYTYTGMHEFFKRQMIPCLLLFLSSSTLSSTCKKSRNWKS